MSQFFVLCAWSSFHALRCSGGLMFRRLIAIVGLVGASSAYADILIPVNPGQQTSQFVCRSFTNAEIGLNPSNNIINSYRVQQCYEWAIQPVWTYHSPIQITALAQPVQSGNWWGGA